MYGKIKQTILYTCFECGTVGQVQMSKEEFENPPENKRARCYVCLEVTNNFLTPCKSHMG